MLYLLGCMGSFIFDFLLRQSVTTNLTTFFVYNTPVPKVAENDPIYQQVVQRGAMLTCTTPEFDALAKGVGIKSHKHGVADEEGRAKLRAELDGLVAHLYGLSESEFAHVLKAFPLVPEPVKNAAVNAYRDVERGLIT